MLWTKRDSLVFDDESSGGASSVNLRIKVLCWILTLSHLLNRAQSLTGWLSVFGAKHRPARRRCELLCVGAAQGNCAVSSLVQSARIRILHIDRCYTYFENGESGRISQEKV